jgi:hypothetical protein
MQLFPPVVDQAISLPAVDDSATSSTPPLLTPTSTPSPTLPYWTSVIPVLSTSDGVGLMRLKYGIRFSFTRGRLMGVVFRMGQHLQGSLYLDDRVIAFQRWIWKSDEPHLNSPMLMCNAAALLSTAEGGDGTRTADGSVFESNALVDWADKSMEGLAIEAGEEDERDRFVGPAYITAEDYVGPKGHWDRVVTEGTPMPLDAACRVAQNGNHLRLGQKLTVDNLLWEVEEMVVWQ